MQHRCEACGEMGFETLWSRVRGLLARLGIGSRFATFRCGWCYQLEWWPRQAAAAELAWARRRHLLQRRGADGAELILAPKLRAVIPFNHEGRQHLVLCQVMSLGQACGCCDADLNLCTDAAGQPAIPGEGGHG